MLNNRLIQSQYPDLIEPAGAPKLKKLHSVIYHYISSVYFTLVQSIVSVTFVLNRQGLLYFPFETKRNNFQIICLIDFLIRSCPASDNFIRFLFSRTKPAVILLQNELKCFAYCGSVRTCLGNVSMIYPWRRWYQRNEFTKHTNAPIAKSLILFRTYSCVCMTGRYLFSTCDKMSLKIFCFFTSIWWKARN